MDVGHIGETYLNDLPETWTPAQRDLYGRVLRFLLSNQAAVTHPNAKLIPERYWLTICHNAAWIAAEIMDGQDFTLVGDDNTVLASTEAVTVLQ